VYTERLKSRREEESEAVHLNDGGIVYIEM
jgi:hypothetical protein